MTNIKSCYINGIKIYSPKRIQELTDYNFFKNKILVAVNAEKIININRIQKDMINKNIGYPDGFGAVWALKSKGLKDTFKISGCDLWLKIIEKNHHSKKFFLIGSTQTVINETIKKLKLEYKNIKIVGFRNGYMNRNDFDDLKIELKKTQPDIIFVAMGSPKQEKLMIKLKSHYNSTYMGLGGSFDVYVGKVSRAPKLWVENNLEWAYRLFREPRRIKRQYKLLIFLFKMLFKRI